MVMPFVPLASCPPLLPVPKTAWRLLWQKSERRGGAGGSCVGFVSAMLALHRARCISWNPSPIVALAATTSSSALSCEDGVPDPHVEVDAGSRARSAAIVAVDDDLLERDRLRLRGTRVKAKNLQCNIFDVLEGAGRAGLTVEEIVEEIQKRGLRKWAEAATPQDTVSSACSTDQAFTRVAAKTYALRAFLAHGVATAGADEQVQPVESNEVHRANNSSDQKPTTPRALGPETHVVAVSRESGRVEVWKADAPGAGPSATRALGWHKAVDIPGVRNVVCNSLAWVVEDGATTRGFSFRLFGATLDGNLVEWDIDARVPKRLTIDSPGCGIWDMKAVQYRTANKGISGCRAVLACACDDGMMRLYGFKGSSNTCSLVKTIKNSEGRLLSVAWFKGRYLAGGGTDGHISCWDAFSSQEVFSIALDVHKKINVWSVEYMADGDIVSGDSSGVVRIWDGTFGTQLKSFALHKGDVLSLAICSDRIYSCGVDGQISCLVREGSDLKQWTYKGKKRPHSHDVSSLAVVGDTLFSGGNDTRLLCYSAAGFLQSHPYNLQSYSELPGIHVAEPSKNNDVRLLCQHLRAIEIWHLPTYDREAAPIAKMQKGREGQPLKTNRAPRLLLVVHSKKCHITCSAISANGLHFLYSDAHRVVHCRLSGESANHKAIQFDATNLCLPPAKACAICSNNTAVVLSMSNSCTVMGLDDKAVVHEVNLDIKPPFNDRFGSHLMDEHVRVSPDATCLAVTSRKRSVLLYDLNTRSIRGNLDTGGIVSAMCFTPDSKVLAVGLFKSGFVLYDVEKAAVANVLLNHGKCIAERLKYASGQISHISFMTSGKDTSMLINTMKGLCIANISKPTKELRLKGGGQLGRKRKHTESLQLALQQGQNPRVIPLEDPCVFAAFLDDRIALMVECSYLRAIQQVQKPVDRRRYGLH